MKNFKTVISTAVLFFFFTPLYSQLWKQYADSAKAYSVQKNVARAIEFYNKAKEELQKDSIGSITYAQICDSLGISHYRKKQYKEAESFFLEAQQIKEKITGKDNPEYAYSCSILGNLYRRTGQFVKAERLLLDSKQIMEKITGKENLKYADVCNSLAIVYKKIRQFDQAEKLYIESKQIRETLLGKENPDYAGSCINLAFLYQEIGQFDKAEPFSIESKQITEKLYGKDNPDYALSCANLALLYWYSGHFKKAEPLYLESKQIYEKLLGKENVYYAGSCLSLGNTYKDMGQYDRAKLFYLESKQIYEKLAGKENPDYANACANLALLYLNMGLYENAEALYLESKQIREKALGTEHPVYADACNNLAILYHDMGLYEKAEQLYLEAMQIRKKTFGNEHPYYAGSCGNIGGLYENMGEYEKAEPLYLEANKILGKLLGKEHPDYAGSCNDLAILYRKMGKFQKAESFQMEAMQIREKTLGKEHPDYASSCEELANLNKDIRKYEKAGQFYLEAKQIQKNMLGKHHADYGRSCDNLAGINWLMHQPLQAEQEFKESFAVNEYNLNAIFQFTNEKEKTTYVKNVLGEDDKAYSFYISEKLSSGQPYSLSLFHRNLILSSSQNLQKQLFYASDSATINKYNEWTDLKKYLSILYSKPIDERKEDVAAIEQRAGQLEKDLARLSSAFKKQQQKVDWKAIQSKLKTDEASIEFAEFRYYDGKQYTGNIYYIAMVLRKDKSIPALVRLFEKKQVDTVLAKTANESTNEVVKDLYVLRGTIIKSKDKNTTINKSIYEIVWKPLEKELKGVKTVYFAPTGLLHRIAFAALPVNNTEVLSDRYQLIQLATTASVTDQTPAFITSSDNLQLYGGIKYDADSTDQQQRISLYAFNTAKEKTRSIPDDFTRSNSFSYLPGTEAEIKTIEKHAGETQKRISVLSGINATEESFKSLNGKASPSVLHVATHGFFFPDPKEDKRDSIQRMFETGGKVFKQSGNPLFRSGLLLAGANNAWKGKPIDGIEDGILTAYEVSNMFLPNTKLVVLSACETALGEIQGSEGVYGLQRAFKNAGVQNLVMSLWKVPDVETAEFMQLFYKNIFARQSISDAFYHAQTTMKKKYRDDPYKWAAWILLR